MSAIGNFLWFIFGGFVTGLSWWICGAVAYISIVGIPWGRACFMLGKLAFLPFGREVIDRKMLNGTDDVGTGSLGLIGNVIWFVFAGIWLAISHVLFGVACCLTIIGIPFGIQHFKLAGAALFPIGKTVVSTDLAAAARTADAAVQLDLRRRKS